MCLGVPGKVTRVYDDGGLCMGAVDFGGASREVCLEYVPEVEPGQYVIVHVGFAISVLDEAEALATLSLIDEILAAGAEDDAPEVPSLAGGDSAGSG